MLFDLCPRQPDRSQLLIGKRPAVEQEADTADSVRLRSQEVHAHEPTTLDLERALLPRLSPARIPRRLAARFDLAAGNCPALLVAGLQDQQPSGGVEDQRPSRGRDPWDFGRRLIG